MKAILCTRFGPPEDLELSEVPSPKPGKGQVTVTVRACGVNFPDTLLIQNKYQFKPPMPFSPGGEVAGLIKEVGEGVRHLSVGDAVLSLTGWGGFAEEVVAEASATLPIPEGMDFETAASIMYTYGTSYHALKNRAHLQPGETLLVLGAAGGVGLAAVQLGILMGASVIAAASSDEKLALCRRMGASATINYATDDIREAVKEITEGNGANVIYDPVGDRFTEPALRSIAWKGRYLVVGFAGGEVPKIPLNLPLLKGCQIVGVFWGAFAKNEPRESQKNFQDVLTWIKQGKLKQHLFKTYALADAPLALRDMMDRRTLGKSVVVM